MPHGEETRRFESLLRARGVDPGGDPSLEREILARYQDACAVLVLDSEGFTRLTQAHGIIHFLALVIAMRDIVRPVLEKHDAIAHWAEGDNLYAVFPAAKQALLAAMQVQEEVAKANTERSEQARLWVSIGMGYGKLLRIATEDVWGDQMNLASKLGEDTAEPREILVTQSFFDAVKAEFGAGTFEPRSVHQGGVEIPYYKVLT